MQPSAIRTMCKMAVKDFMIGAGNLMWTPPIVRERTAASPDLRRVLGGSVKDRVLGAR